MIHRYQTPLVGGTGDGLQILVGLSDDKTPQKVRTQYFRCCVLCDGKFVYYQGFPFVRRAPDNRSSDREYPNRKIMMAFLARDVANITRRRIYFGLRPNIVNGKEISFIDPKTRLEKHALSDCEPFIGEGFSTFCRLFRAARNSRKPE